MLTGVAFWRVEGIQETGYGIQNTGYRIQDTGDRRFRCFFAKRRKTIGVLAKMTP